MKWSPNIHKMAQHKLTHSQLMLHGTQTIPTPQTNHAQSTHSQPQTHKNTTHKLYVPQTNHTHMHITPIPCITPTHTTYILHTTHKYASETHHVHTCYVTIYHTPKRTSHTTYALHTMPYISHIVHIPDNQYLPISPLCSHREVVNSWQWEHCLRYK